MKFTALFVFSIFSFVTFSQDLKPINVKFKKKSYDTYGIQTMNDGGFIVVGTNRTEFSDKGDGFVLNAAGEVVTTMKGAVARTFAKKTNHLYDVSPNAMHNIYKKYMFNAQTGVMYAFKYDKGNIVVKTTNIHEESEKYTLSDKRIEGGAKMVSWDVVELNEHTYRHLFVFNFADKEKVSVLQVDYNWTKNTFDLKQKFWIQSETGIGGWSRPKLKILDQKEGEGMICLLYTHESYTICSLNEELSPVFCGQKMKTTQNDAMINDAKLCRAKNGKNIVFVEYKRLNVGTYNYQYDFFLDMICLGSEMYDDVENIILSDRPMELTLGNFTSPKYNKGNEYFTYSLSREDDIVVTNKNIVQVLKMDDEYGNVMESEYYNSAYKCFGDAPFPVLNDDADDFYEEQDGVESERMYEGAYVYDAKNKRTIVLHAKGGLKLLYALD